MLVGLLYSVFITFNIHIPSIPYAHPNFPCGSVGVETAYLYVLRLAACSQSAVWRDGDMIPELPSSSPRAFVWLHDVVVPPARRLRKTRGARGGRSQNCRRDWWLKYDLDLDQEPDLLWLHLLALLICLILNILRYLRPPFTLCLPSPNMTFFGITWDHTLGSPI